MKSIRFESKLTFLLVNVQLFPCYVLKRLLLCSFVCDKLTVFTYIYLQDIYSVLFICLCIFHQYHMWLLSGSLEVGQHLFSNFVLFQYCVATLGPLPIHINFRISLLIFVRLFARILVGIASSWGELIILKILSLPIHEHRLFPHLFCSSLISCIRYCLLNYFMMTYLKSLSDNFNIWWNSVLMSVCFLFLFSWWFFWFLVWWMIFNWVLDRMLH